jgi:hypothetical protein
MFWVSLTSFNGAVSVHNSGCNDMKLSKELCLCLPNCQMVVWVSLGKQPQLKKVCQIEVKADI